jgi:hypothetical protein
MQTSKFYFILQDWPSNYYCFAMRVGSLLSVAGNHVFLLLIMTEKLLGIRSIKERSKRWTRYGNIICFSIWIALAVVTLVLELTGLLDRNDHCFGMPLLDSIHSYLLVIFCLVSTTTVWLLFAATARQVHDMKRVVRGQVSGTIHLGDVIKNTLPFVVNNTGFSVVYVSVVLSKWMRDAHIIASVALVAFCSGLNPGFHTFLTWNFIKYFMKYL